MPGILMPRGYIVPKLWAKFADAVDSLRFSRILQHFLSLVMVQTPKF